MPTLLKVEDEPLQAEEPKLSIHRYFQLNVRPKEPRCRPSDQVITIIEVFGADVPHESVGAYVTASYPHIAFRHTPISWTPIGKTISRRIHERRRILLKFVSRQWTRATHYSIMPSGKVFILLSRRMIDESGKTYDAPYVVVFRPTA